jgi:hypothetical protein
MEHRTLAIVPTRVSDVSHAVFNWMTHPGAEAIARTRLRDIFDDDNE